MMDTWVYVTGGGELVPIELDGVNVWEHDWRAVAGASVMVRDPAYGQHFEFDVYHITVGRRTIIFAAGEFSNGMWGFYQPRSNEELKPTASPSSLVE